MTGPLVLATTNQGKVGELREIIADRMAGGVVQILTAADLNLPEVPETGSTFHANALLKAKSAATVSGLVAVADDSGLVVEALDGAPGVHSARYAAMNGHEAAESGDEANMALLLERLAAHPQPWSAAFVCAAALVTPGGMAEVVEGRLEGHIIASPAGSNGFGYDPLFVPTGETRTTAEMSPSEKNAISHRGQAFRALAPVIISALGRDSA